MNFSDSEIIASVMNDKGFEQTDQINQADIIFVNTCSIREVRADESDDNASDKPQDTRHENP